MKTLFVGLLALSMFAQAPATPAAATREDGTYARLSIVQGTAPVGDIVFKFFEKEAPLTSANFIGLASGTKLWTDPKTGKRVRRKFYDGLTFHRVIPGFMIQGGDPLGNGTGSVDVVKDEFKNGLVFDVPGRVAMAHAGPGTASSQFFITERNTPQLNGDYTIFGQVVEGQDLVPKIANTPRGPNDRPNVTVRIAKVTIERVGAPPARPVTAAKPAAGTAKKGVTAAKKAAPKK
jgi:peptidyl-prolyl cis-trans isomerase A (cyclophilin A)